MRFSGLLARLQTDHDGDPLIVFIHIPKTAGSSFRIAAESYFGMSAVECDYGVNGIYTTDIIHETVYSDRIGALPPAMDQLSTRMLAGHFPVIKYRDVFTKNVRWCTFLRNPVQRVISEHHDLTTTAQYEKSLECFCNTKAQCNKQTRLLRGIPEEDLYFVGVTEYFRESIAAFNKLAGTKFHYNEANRAKDRLTEVYNLPDKILQTIEDNNQKDLELYSKYAAQYTS